ncbi:MAG: DUF1206 domain-containing protein [Acidimicrobiia bacterium]|nr:DUF1206 domain-containing protein [Acidimicrobiia bacterium]
MTTMTKATGASMNQQVVRIGRVAIATQGVLYGAVGLLAVQVARGDSGAKASQTGAIETVVEQPFGRILLFILVVGLVAHATWRLVLAVRGEPGDDEDGKSLAKRAANAGRAAIYISFTVLAVKILTQKQSSGGNKQKESTAEVLSWPGGRWIVIAAGLAVIAAGLWNAKKGITRSFLDDLDLGSLDQSRRRAVEVLGSVGYIARAVAFALVGWFLLTAGRQGDAKETRGLDESLRELAETSHGPILLLILAVGMVLFGAYRVLDAILRRPSEISHA